jgi:hypothetical protein
LRQEDCEFKVSLGNIERTHFKKKRISGGNREPQKVVKQVRECLKITGQK